MKTIESLRAALCGARLVSSNERELQNRIEAVLKDAQIEFQREYPLSRRDRVDFFLPAEGVAVEVKVQCGTMPLLRQLKRYADAAEVRAVVVVSTRPYRLPETLSGKPIEGISLWKGAL